jgi:lysophospholipase L1-like esterase
MEAFIRGCAWEGTSDVPYPRADPSDAARLPGDTWAMAQVPVGVRIEFVGDARFVDVEYRASAPAGSRVAFELWRAGVLVSSAEAAPGAGVVRLAAGRGSDDDRRTVYLPESLRPTVVGLTAVDGSLEPAPAQPRWLAYGDSIAEGWVASAPSGPWPAVAGRSFGLDVVNCGYAGAARGEIASAEQLSNVAADVISVSHGTNCWTRIPHSAAMVAAGMDAFLTVLRQGHPATPIVLVSPVVRPDAEASENRLGATLADLRAAIEEVAVDRGDVTLVRGLPLLGPSLLADGVHPGDSGHAVLAASIGPVVRELV